MGVLMENTLILFAWRTQPFYSTTHGVIEEAMHRRGYPMLCTKPSVIQHIGQFGQFSNAGVGFDRATDFESTESRPNGKWTCDQSG